ncbi:hypothetical protein JK359_36760 [Streptomyces actinomycinicus]|uniref:Uncharacterized protein n=1 Tax=Streptomyces actinomycinicus TaxID=1695166 RepID=A0A937ERU8_9ACTN|nr:hypothetical protein [Streptomyces actinomycinicus]MBL1087443.1 hypothetical protein [Streptomyces actinomycinicus]
MSTQAFQGAYLLPLFHAIEQARGEDAYQQLPAPAPASSLAADDAPLGVYCAAHLIRSSYTAGLAHADALRRLTAAGEVDPTSPWTLLRGALENFATALWLLDGTGRSERRRRALSLWDEDMRNRHQHETDTGYLPSGGGMSGAQRRAEIRAIADQLGLAPLTAPRTHQILLTAAPAAGLPAVKVCAVWRAASGFAHGRYWPNLRASQPRAAMAETGGVHTIAFVIDEDQHRPLAEYCHTMLSRLQEHYAARAQAHGQRSDWPGRRKKTLGPLGHHRVLHIDGRAEEG